MAKQKHWCEGLESEALQLREAGWTPQEICTHFAKSKRGDPKYYNSAKLWYLRTFKDWQPRQPSNTQQQHQQQQSPSLSNIVSHQQPINPYSTVNSPSVQQQQPRGAFQDAHYFVDRAAIHRNTNPSSSYLQNRVEREDMPSNNDTPSAVSQTKPSYSGHYGTANLVPSYTGGQLADVQDPFGGQVVQPQQSSTLQQGLFTMAQAGYLQQPMAQSNEEGGIVQRLDGQTAGMGDMSLTAPGSSGTYFPYPDPLDQSELGNVGRINKDLDFSPDSQSFPADDFTAPTELEFSQKQMFNARSSDQTPQYQNGFVFYQAGTETSQVQATSNPKFLNAPHVQHTGAGRTSCKHQRTSSVFGDPSPPPKRPLPPTPLAKQNVLRNRGNGWRLLHVNGQGDVAHVDPNKLPKGTPTKRVKGLAKRSHDSLALYRPRQPATLSPEASESAHLNAEQPATARDSLKPQPVSPSNASIHSSLRDSGYISLVDSTMITVHESLESALSTMKLTGEADDGFVDVEITTKARMRRSRYMEQMSSTFPLSPET